MKVYLLVDFGSTYTKIIAVDLEQEMILGRSQSPTTISTDITIGLNNALEKLYRNYGIDKTQIQGKLASSSAAGGLKMAAIGLVPELTLEAARRAALGAGAKVISSHGFEVDEEAVREIEAAGCDIILLCGGTDGGDKKVILHNAKMLANSNIDCPIIVAGNRVVMSQVRRILGEKDKKVYITKNVLPNLTTVDVEPAQALIRGIFIAHITKAKGLDKAQKAIGQIIMPTPKATLQAAALLANGTDNEPGIGSLVVVEIGGATTNIHSVVDSLPVTDQTILKGLPESRVTRTVEGDLGIRYNASTLYDYVGAGPFLTNFRRNVPQFNGDSIHIEQHIRNLAENVNYVPTREVERHLDITLAEAATSIAVQRHAGTIRKEYSLMGEVLVQHGKNLLDTKNLVGTGGIFKYGRHPEKILRAALYNTETPWSLKPREPKAYVDCEYILYGIGLLAESFQDQALRIAKKYIKQTSL